MNGLLTASEAAARLKVHINTIYLYLERGKLKGFRVIGNRWRIKEQDLKAFINGRGAGQHTGSQVNVEPEQVASPAPRSKGQ